MWKMPTCCVPGCASGYRKDASSSDRHFFYAPSDVGLRSAWNKAIPRADKELTTKSRVCDLHFHEQDILKTYVHVIDGKTIEIPRGKWSLAKDAVPKVFPNLPAYLSKPAAKKRKPRREIMKQTSTETPGQHNDSPCVYLEQPEGSQILDAQKLTIADMKSVELPSGWRMITLVSDNSSEGESVAFFTLKHGTECLQIEKSVVVNSESSATASAYGRAATAYASIPIRAVEDLTSLLKAVHKLHACEGCQRQCYACISPKCKVLSPQQTCAACRTHDKKLAREATRLRNALVDKGSRLRNLRKKKC